jgi:hypothetical protein
MIILKLIIWRNTMPISIKEAGEIRDRTHNLDLNDPKHCKIFDSNNPPPKTGTAIKLRKIIA